MLARVVLIFFIYCYLFIYCRARVRRVGSVIFIYCTTPFYYFFIYCTTRRRVLARVIFITDVGFSDFLIYFFIKLNYE